MVQRLRPWQAATVLTVVALVVRLVVLTSEPEQTGAEEMSPLSPPASEIALTFASFALLFAVLWAVLWLLLSVLVRLRRRRDRTSES